MCPPLPPPPLFPFFWHGVVLVHLFFLDCVSLNRLPLHLWTRLSSWQSQLGMTLKSLSPAPISSSCFSPACHLFLELCKLACHQHPDFLRPEPSPPPVPNSCKWRFLICASLSLGLRILISVPSVPFLNGDLFCLSCHHYCLPPKPLSYLNLDPSEPFPDLFQTAPNVSSLFPAPTLSKPFCTVVQLRFLAFCSSYTNCPFKNNKRTSLAPYFA